MKKISRITVQKNQKERYNIFIHDGKKEFFAFGLDEAILIEYRLRKGMEISEDLMETLKKKDHLHRSYLQAINYLSYRMRTEKEIRTFLLKKEVDPAHIPPIIERLKREKLLDDRQFAEMFVRTRINTSMKGPMYIKKELLEKGVSVQNAEAALLQFTNELQYEKVAKILEKLRNSTKKVSFQKQKQQWQQKIMQKGFHQDIIQQVMSDLAYEANHDEEWEAVQYQGEKLLRKYQRKYEGYELEQKLKEGLYRRGFAFDLIQQFIESELDE